MSEVLVGRQPIYTPQLDLFAYELLFRGDGPRPSTFADGDEATAKVMLNTLIEIGLDRVVGRVPVFVNITRNLFLNGFCMSLPRDRVVLEVLEDIQPEPEVLQALTDLSEKGYSIALDDFVFEPELAPLVEIANIVKIEVQEARLEDLVPLVTRLRQFDVQLIAEKVETYEAFDVCKNIGFDFFQGYFLCRPKVVQGQQIPANRLSLLRLIAKLQDPNVKLTELEQIIGTDLSLAYKMLRFVNSAICSVNRKVESIRDAAVFVGLDRIRTWASLLMLSRMDAKPLELVVTAATRAKMCELLARAMQQQRTDRYFTVGLLSVLDAFMDKRMLELLNVLPLSDEINNALLNKDGILGETLRCVVSYEHGEWDKIGCHNLTAVEIRAAYLEAISWSSEFATRMAETA